MMIHLTLMGTGQVLIDEMASYLHQILSSKGRQELVNIYWQCVAIKTFKSIRPAIMGGLPV